MDKKIILIIVGVVGLVCVACIGLVVVLSGVILSATQGIADASDDYLEALKQGDYATAYDLSAPVLRADFGSVEGLQSFVAQNNFVPESWNFNSRSVVNNTGTLTGTITLQNGTVVNTEMYFQKIDDDWLVTGFDTNPQ
jgi:hypothetical protein